MILGASHVENSVLDATSLVGATIRRKAQDNDRVRGLQVDPVFEREVVERQQLVEVVGDLGGRLRPFAAQLVTEGLSSDPCVLFVLGVTDLRQELLRERLDRGRQHPKDVPRLVKPVALFAGLGEDEPERLPEPERPVADGHHRGFHAAVTQVTQQRLPGIGGLPVALSDGDELLVAVLAHSDDDKSAQAGLLEANVEVHAVDPDVDVVPIGKRPVHEGLVLGLPGHTEAPDRRGREPG